ncbi:MAG: YciI family protein [Rhodoglobus sp.]
MSQEYIILIVEPEWDPSSISEADWTAAMAQHGAFAKAVADAGQQVLGGDALQPSSAAVRIVPARDGKPAVFTDGPFTELKEVVSGFYKISARDLAQAKELAALCPSPGHIELYPVLDTGSME